MVFEFKMDRRGYEIQGDSEGSFQNAIVDTPAGDHEELRTDMPDIFSFPY